MLTSFQSLALRVELHEGLAAAGYLTPTPIQAQALPAMLEGVDLVGQARTGSGKTAAFGLALLQQVDTEVNRPQALVICPTRELADQVGAELRKLASRLPNLRILSLCGGQPDRDQKRGLEGGCHVIVGTPGRLRKHLESGRLDVVALRVLVLDEADRLLEMGFLDEVDAIVGVCPKPRQTLLFSATFPEAIDHLWQRVCEAPFRVSVEVQVAPDLLRQVAVSCPPDQRHATVARILRTVNPASALVFCETREECEELTAALQARGADALALHGQLDQRDRDGALIQLLHGSVVVMVATNVAARGLDIPALPLVVVAELSPDPESHLHRIGRTGRAGEAGLAVSVVASNRERSRLEAIEAFFGQRIERGMELVEGESLTALRAKNRSLLILAGREDKISRGDVLGALVKEGGIPPEAIGRLDLGRKTCAVAVERAWASQAYRYLQSGRVKGQRVRVTALGGLG